MGADLNLPDVTLKRQLQLLDSAPRVCVGGGWGAVTVDSFSIFPLAVLIRLPLRGHMASSSWLTTRMTTLTM